MQKREPMNDLSAESLRAAALHVLGDSDVGRSIVELCDDHAQAVKWIMDQRIPDATTISVVGATGQGKSWLVRQFIRNDSVKRALPTGDTQRDATRQLVWIGPQPPTAVNSDVESFLYCSADEMAELGSRYIVVDTPGTTDVDPSTVQAASQAIAMSGVLILVVRRQQLRSEVSRKIAEAGEGSVVLPVITAVKEEANSQELRSDIDALLARLRTVASRSEILPAVIVGDFEVGEASEDSVAGEAVSAIANALKPHLASGEIGNQRRKARLQAAEDRFHESVRRQLAQHVPRLSSALQHLDEAIIQLPHDVAVELIGSGPTLRAGIRSRLRAELMICTAAIWFPYRTLLGLLNLTHGAWDRLILALSGSLPSLAGSVWAGFQNMRESNQRQALSDGIHARSAAMIADRITPLVERFHKELSRLRVGHGVRTDGGEDARGSSPAQLYGLDSLQEQTQQIFDDEVASASPSSRSGMLLGLIGTAVFWALLAGPIVALYRSYFGASVESLSQLNGDLEAFPRPEFAMVLTSLVLSILPTAIFAMLVLTWVQRRSRQEAAAKNIEDKIREAIEQLQAQRVLRLEFSDEFVDDARRLLKASEA